MKTAAPPRSETPATVAELRRIGRNRLKAAGIDSAALDADLLLAHALGIAREELLMRAPGEPVADHLAAAFMALVDERARRVPAAYLLGGREFYGRRFAVGPGVLVPRPETETLVDAVLAALPEDRIELLDLGVGSGAILLTLLAERPAWRGIGVDRSAVAAAYARRNAGALGVASRAAVVVGDWDAALDPAWRPQLIVANPPYIARGEIAGLAPEVRLHEPRLALDGGRDGLDGLRAVIAVASRRLAPQGLLFCEIGADQGEAGQALLAAAGFREIRGFRDLAGRARVLMGRLAR